MKARLLVLVLMLATTPAPAAASRSAVGGVPHGMVRIPGGSYRPLYAVSDTVRVRVRPFALDRLPVTRADYLAFVRTHPEWRRNAVRPSLAEHGYLADWSGPLNAGGADDLRLPVTGVSWYAARAYCIAEGGRLPSVAEWEYAANDGRAVRSGSAANRRALAAVYGARRPGRLPFAGASPANGYGVRDLHGVVWEWTLDFNATVPAHHSHAAGAATAAHDHRVSCATATIGATDPSDYPAFARHAIRAGLSARSTVSSVGFRCAADLPG